jgi:hypothetical protein
LIGAKMSYLFPDWIINILSLSWLAHHSHMTWAWPGMVDSWIRLSAQKMYLVFKKI